MLNSVALKFQRATVKLSILHMLCLLSTIPLMTVRSLPDIQATGEIVLELTAMLIFLRHILLEKLTVQPN